MLFIGAKHRLGSIGLREKFHPTELNRIEENSICCRPFIMYKPFEIEVNSLQQVQIDCVDLDFSVDPINVDSKSSIDPFKLIYFFLSI